MYQRFYKHATSTFERDIKWGVNYKFFLSNCKRCNLPLNLTSFVFIISKSCTLCPLAQTQLDFLVKYGHVTYT
ncbi:hypothetical protein Hanom_Chr06g00558141 [Helianthus anomalus]